MRRVYKNLCPATISASIIAANMWKHRLKNVESDNNNILYETLIDFLQRNGTYFLNKPRIYKHIHTINPHFMSSKLDHSLVTYKSQEFYIHKHTFYVCVLKVKCLHFEKVSMNYLTLFWTISHL